MSRAAQRRRYAIRTEVLGVAFDGLTMEQAISEGQRLAQAEGVSYVVTPNPEFVAMARRDEAFRQILNHAALVLPDGVGITYAAKILGTPLPGRVPGIDFADGLMPALAKHGLRLYLLGAKPGIAERAAKRLTDQHPGLTVCGVHDGYFTDDAAVTETVRAARPDVVIVCLGAPRQEKWMAAHGAETGARLLIGLGGALDVFAGAVKRAPKGFQRLGLEWFYRLCKEPRRIGRMAKLPLFLCAAVGARLRGGRA